LAVILIAAFINLLIAIIKRSIFGFIISLIIGLIEIALLRMFTNKNQFKVMVEFLK